MNPTTEPPASSAKRELLLDTAWDLFCRNGYRAVGIDTVLAAAGVAKMTLYNHFDSKEDLIAAAMTKKAAEFAASLDATIEGAGRNPAKRLLAVFDWLEAWFSTESFTGCAFLKAVGEFPGPGDKPRLAAIAFKRGLQTRLEQLCAEAGLRHPPALARQLMLLVDGATIHADMHSSAAYARDARTAAKALIEAGAR
ncbi:MAG: TetR/AcrR family transcriptional regulator [Lacunisphaera sp.]|nr:TetR/AcrR family transcriptional regulator [Lacunisphaera sp.]